MPRLITLAFALVLSFSSNSCSSKAGLTTANDTFLGHWEGSIGTPSGSLRLFIHVEQDSSGKPKAFLDSPDQLAFQIPVTLVEIRQDSIDLKIVNLMASFIGKLSSSGDRIDGQWEQGPNVAQLTLKRNDEVAFSRPQEPHAPFPYTQEDFKLTLRDKGTLAGTLTLPQGSGPFPLAILLTGSGTQDRNETIAAHKPFLVLADHLTRNGIAVLRYDDRGAGASKANANLGADESAKDVQEIIRWVRSNTKIDQSKIGLIGHSEGGWIATMAAALEPVAYTVLLASPSLSGDSILMLQYEKFSATLPPAMKFTQRRMLTMIKEVRDSATLRKQLTDLYEAAYDSAGPEIHAMFKTGKAYATANVSQLMTKPMQFLIRYDPKPDLLKLKIPTLALYGSKDIQVPAKQNSTPMTQALAANPNAKVIVLPDLNHLFQTAPTGELKEYGTIKETLSPVALKTITDWITATVK